jgi:hypothetical protein
VALAALLATAAPAPAQRPVRLICNKFLSSGNRAYFARAPRKCDIWRSNWAHYQSLSMRRASWRHWGRAVATGHVTVIYNMHYRHRFTVKAFRRRLDCTGKRLIYTRVRIVGRHHVWRPHTCPGFDPY